jgi:hypothetical protein
MGGEAWRVSGKAGVVMLKNIWTSIRIALLVVGTSVAAASQAAAEGGVKVGVLTCNVSGGWGFVLGSSKDVRCNYAPTKGVSEHYDGTISKVGVDIGYTQSGVIIWNVIAPASDVKPGALEGGYGGVTAGATVGVGLGANVLLGGSNKSIALQPLSIEGNTGLNVAAGIGGLNLKYNKG